MKQVFTVGLQINQSPIQFLITKKISEQVVLKTFNNPSSWIMLRLKIDKSGLFRNYK
jgi:hypothetical protein